MNEVGVACVARDIGKSARAMHLARAAAAAGAAVGAVGIAVGRIRVHAEGDGRERLSPEALPNGVQQSLYGWQHVVTTSGTDASGVHSVRDVVQHCA